MIRKSILIFLAIFLFGCSEQSGIMTSEPEGSITNFSEDTHGTYASTYEPLTSEETVIRNATVFDGNGNKFQNYDVHFANGEIQEVGRDIIVGDITEIDGTGKFVTPGIIDNHSHMGCLLYTSDAADE